MLNRSSDVTLEKISTDIDFFLQKAPEDEKNQALDDLASLLLWETKPSIFFLPAACYQATSYAGFFHKPFSYFFRQNNSSIVDPLTTIKDALNQRILQPQIRALIIQKLRDNYAGEHNWQDNFVIDYTLHEIVLWGLALKNSSATFLNLFCLPQDSCLHFTAFSTAIKNSNVSSISLQSNIYLNRLTATQWTIFCDIFKSGFITSLDLSKNSLNSFTREHWISFGASLKGSNMTTLNLSYVCLGSFTSDIFSAFCTALKESSIISLDLNWCGLYSITYHSYYDGPRKFCTLKDSKTTHRTPTKHKEFCDVIKNSKITSLNLENNHLGSLTLSEWINFVDAIKNSSLISLNLSSNALHILTSEDWALLRAALKDSSVRFLSLSHNFLRCLTTEQWTAFCSVIKDSSAISLNLSWTTLSYGFSDLHSFELESRTLSEWRTFCTALKESSLISLDLSENDLHILTIEQWSIFCEAIKVSHLTSLNLRENGLHKLTSEAWSLFGAALIHSKMISLNLSGNQLHDLASPEWNNFLTEISESSLETVIFDNDISINMKHYRVNRRSLFNNTDDYTQLCKFTGHQFQDKKLLAKALTRASALSSGLQGRDIGHNASLATHGDGILRSVVEDILLELRPDYSSGDLSRERDKLVSNRHLAEIADSHRISRFIMMDNAEMDSSHANNRKLKNKTWNLKQKILADTLEAIIGALFNDSGKDYKVVKRFIVNCWGFKSEYNKHLSSVVLNKGNSIDEYFFRCHFEKNYLFEVQKRLNINEKKIIHWLECGADPEFVPGLLFISVACRNADIVMTLLKAGADVNKARSDGRTPLYQAAHQGSLDLAITLLNHGAQFHPEDGTGYTPLHAAVLSNDLEMIKLLLKNGAKINCQDQDGNTPLHIAVLKSKNDLSIIVELLKYQPDLLVRNKHFKRAADLRVDADILELLEKTEKKLIAENNGFFDYIRRISYFGGPTSPSSKTTNTEDLSPVAPKKNSTPCAIL